MLAEVRRDRVHNGQECLDKASDDVRISVAARSNYVALFDADHVIEQHNNLLVLHFIVVRLSLLEGLIDLIDHY